MHKDLECKFLDFNSTPYNAVAIWFVCGVIFPFWLSRVFSPGSFSDFLGCEARLVHWKDCSGDKTYMDDCLAQKWKRDLNFNLIFQGSLRSNMWVVFIRIGNMWCLNTLGRSASLNTLTICILNRFRISLRLTYNWIEWPKKVCRYFTILKFHLSDHIDQGTWLIWTSMRLVDA